MPHKMQPGETRESYLQKAIKHVRKHYKMMRTRETCHTNHTAQDAMLALEKLYPDLGTFGSDNRVGLP